MYPRAVSAVSARWSAPAHVRALTTLRQGGFSTGPYLSLNIGDHVGDELSAVRRNRNLLRDTFGLPSEPVWLRQIHGTEIVDAAQVAPGVAADGSYTDKPGVVCTVLTADCLPLFLCDRCGDQVALVHVGWRGLVTGIVERGVAVFESQPSELLAWMGPAIGSRAYEVGPDVYRSFSASDHGYPGAFKVSTREDHWFADLCALTRVRLEQSGLREIYGLDTCTYSEEGSFFSHRRDHPCGRMASLIWLE